MGYFYLAASTVLATVWALCYKIAAKRGCELRAVNLWVYIGATGILLVNYFARGAAFNAAAGGLGLATGVSVYIATLSFFYPIRTGKLSVSWAVIGLSVGFPIIASIIIWGEEPTTRQWVGLALIPVAFILCNAQGRKVEPQ